MTFNKFIPKSKVSKPEPMSRHQARRLEVVRLRREGKTLKEISDIVGFPSANAVSLFIHEHGRARNNG